MASRNWRLMGALLGLGWICSACGGASSATTKPDAPITCEPGTRRCDGDDIKICNAGGTDETTEETCAKGQCQARGNAYAYCSTASTPATPSMPDTPSMPAMPAPCAASLAVCNGSVATTCKADGSGPEPGGVDCAARKQHCVRGECSDTHCAPDTKSCQNGDVYLCASDGLSLAVWDYCADDESCDEPSGTCLGHVCTPGEVTCSGTRVSTCDALGSRWVPAMTDCAAQGKVCLDGRCEQAICTPSTTFCQEGNLYQCDPTGARAKLARTCRAGVEHCAATPAGLYAFCVANACVPGEVVCAGNALKTCDADGSLPAAGTDCGKDEFCKDATCKPLGCVLGSLFCKDNDVYSCEPDGPTSYTTCDAGSACLALLPAQDLPDINSNLTSCMPVSCPPGQTGCVLDKIGTCAADGAGLSAVTNDCAASNKVCTREATCAASVIETVGIDRYAEPVSEGPYQGNLIDVHSSRKLTELQMWLAFQSPRDLRWIIYEQIGNDLVLKAEKTTTVASSAGFASSGPLSFSFTLQAGKRYALGVVAPGNSISYYGSTAPLPRSESPSFGSLLGSVGAYVDFTNLTITSNFSPNLVAFMKVTTESP